MVNHKPVQIGVELAQSNHIRMEQVTEALGGHEYQVWYVVALDPGENAPAEMGENEFYILGDHRSNSKDSRFIGKVPRENIVGAALRVHSSNDHRREGKELFIRK